MYTDRPREHMRPLDSWGSFNGHIRTSDSPYIKSVWKGTAFRDSIHKTAADGTIDLVVSKKQGITRLLLSGPTSKARVAAIRAGDEIMVVRLRPGVHLPFIFSTKLVDVEQFLANAGKRGFWLHNTVFSFPDFDNIETFVERLARLGLLKRDIIIEDAFADRSRNVSARTVQRHFLETTGLTMKHLLQIRRAESARNLLKSGWSLTAIADETGYSNLSHMTHAFAYFFGQTPSAMRKAMAQKTDK